MKHTHLTDEQLIATCLAGPVSDADQHGDRRRRVRARVSRRRAALAGLLDEVSTSATVGVRRRRFPPERLAASSTRESSQRLDQQRLDQHRAGRVIAFPLAHAQRASQLHTRPVRRWIAGAAAAGLLIGMVAGHLVHELPVGLGHPSAGPARRQPAGSVPLRALERTDVRRRVPARNRGGGRQLRPRRPQTDRRRDTGRLGSPRSAVPPLIFRKGLDLKHEVAHVLAESYHSSLVAAIKEHDYRHSAGRLTIHLAREFGFCYGVDRAVDYAYQARKRFPDRQVHLTGEIIHNPHVNNELRAQGIRFLSDPGAIARRRSAPMTSSSCRRSASPSNSSVSSKPAAARSWTRRAGRCSTSGRTSSGTPTTASRRSSTANIGTRKHARRRRRRAAERPRALPRRAEPGRRRCWSATTFVTAAIAQRSWPAFAHAASPGLRSGHPPSADRVRQPDDDAQLGVARDRRPLPRRPCATATATRSSRHGSAPSTRSAAPRRTGRTPSWRCSTRSALDLMVVIGGYNSSNTQNLARICAGRAADLPHCRPGRDRRRPRTDRSTGRSRAVARSPRPAGCREGALAVD